MRNIFVLTDLVGREIQDTTWELSTVARRAEACATVTGIVLGSDVSGLLPELIRWFDEVIVLDDEMLLVPDADVTVGALSPLIGREKPFCVLAAHSNGVMDFAPALAVRLDRPLITDCLSIDLSGDAGAAGRPPHGGKGDPPPPRVFFFVCAIFPQATQWLTQARFRNSLRVNRTISGMEK